MTLRSLLFGKRRAFPAHVTLAESVAPLKKRSRRISFLNIGANDGVINDGLHPFVEPDHWRGAFVEPQAEVFDRLRKNYERFPFVRFIRAAVAEKNQTKILYSVAFSSERWATGLSSFSLQHLHHHRHYIADMARKQGVIPPIDTSEWFVAIEVPCISFAALLRRCRMIHVDILHIDTEGHDSAIIRSIPVWCRPTVIRYEHCNLSHGDRRACEEFLIKRGYLLYEQDRMDTLAVRKKHLRKIQRQIHSIAE